MTPKKLCGISLLTCLTWIPGVSSFIQVNYLCFTQVCCNIAVFQSSAYIKHCLNIIISASYQREPQSKRKMWSRRYNTSTSSTTTKASTSSLYLLSRLKPITVPWANVASESIPSVCTGRVKTGVVEANGDDVFAVAASVVTDGTVDLTQDGFKTAAWSKTVLMRLGITMGSGNRILWLVNQCFDVLPLSLQ